MRDPGHPGEIDRMVGGARSMEMGVSSPKFLPGKGEPPEVTKAFASSKPGGRGISAPRPKKPGKPPPPGKPGRGIGGVYDIGRKKPPKGIGRGKKK